jgi:hypothetical protein
MDDGIIKCAVRFDKTDSLAAAALQRTRPVHDLARGNASCAQATALAVEDLVVLSLEAARRERPDTGLGFFAGSWNRNPAHEIAPASLAAIWTKAKAA